LDRSDPLNQFIHKHNTSIKGSSPHSLAEDDQHQRIWKAALEIEWDGDLSILPIEHSPDLEVFFLIQTREMYHRLTEVIDNFPTECRFIGMRESLSGTEKLVFITAKLGWVDLFSQLSCSKDLKLKIAAAVGSDKVLHSLDDESFNDREIRPAVGKAAMCDNVVAMTYIHRRFPSLINSELTQLAAHYGSLKVIMYLHSLKDDNINIGGLFDAKVMDHAAASGNLELVRFLDQNRMEGFTVNAIDFAAMYGHLPVVEYLSEHRSEGWHWAFVHAVLTEHWDVVEYLHRNGCTKDCQRMMQTKSNRLYQICPAVSETK
jgi:hypothetical protein